MSCVVFGIGLYFLHLKKKLKLRKINKLLLTSIAIRIFSISILNYQAILLLIT